MIEKFVTIPGIERFYVTTTFADVTLMSPRPQTTRETINNRGHAAGATQPFFLFSRAEGDRVVRARAGVASEEGRAGALVVSVRVRVRAVLLCKAVSHPYRDTALGNDALK